MIEILAASHKGKVREQNQDSYAGQVLGDGTAYAVVCDGMGGENAGDVAGRMACRILEAHFQRSLEQGLSEMTVRNIFAAAFQDANMQVYQAAQEKPEFRGMGTTAVAAAVLEGKIYFAHVGDSRIYVKDKLGARQLTKDHTMVQRMLDRGEITPEEAKRHPQRHYLIRALGVESQVEFDFDLYEGFGPGSAVLLCSDGLSNYLEGQELSALLEQCASDKSAQPLVDFANAKGGHDNITALVILP